MIPPKWVCYNDPCLVMGFNQKKGGVPNGRLNPQSSPSNPIYMRRWWDSGMNSAMLVSFLWGPASENVTFLFKCQENIVKHSNVAFF